MPEEKEGLPHSPELERALEEMRDWLIGEDVGHGVTLSALELGQLPAPYSAFSDWLGLVAPASLTEQLGDGVLSRADRAAAPLRRHGPLQEADLARLGQLSPPHVPVGLKQQGLERLWELLKGRTPEQQKAEAGRTASRNRRGHER